MKKFLHSGEKIKYLRKAMDLKQDDITSNEISKSLISMIEQNKRTLTWNTAVIIAESLNKYYQSSGKEITAEYLMESDGEKIKNSVKSYMDELVKAIDSEDVDEGLIHKTFDQAIALVEEYNFKKEMIDLKILRGDFYSKNYQYKEAINDFFDVVGHSIQINDYNQVARLYLRLGAAYQMQLMIETAIIHFEKAYEIAITHKPSDQEKIKVYSLFNQITCYRRIKRYDIVVSLIKNFKNLKWDNPLFQVFLGQILIIEANTLRDTGNTSRAMRMYDDLLNGNQLNKDSQYLIYENFAILYMRLGKVKKALEYLDRASAIKDDVSVNYRPALYLYQAQCYNLSGKYEKVLNLLEHALTLAEWVSKKHMVIDIHFAFVEAYLGIKNYSKVEHHLQEAETIIKEKDFKTKMLDLYTYYIDLYSELGSGEKVIEYSSKLRSQNYLRC